MLSFESDYILGAHEQVLDALIKTNNEVLSGYGNDPHTENAKALIRSYCECPDAQIYFLTGGTQANKTVIASMLGDTEGVIAAVTGHISLHEAGAVEYTGHKVIELPGREGKLSPLAVGEYMKSFYADDNNGMMVAPGMIYISHPTEYGTLYTKDELIAFREICDRYGMSLFLDGARLAYGLAAKNTDVTLADIARLTDVFYIGGTKVGALCGEAVVFTKNNAPKRFNSTVKMHGAMIAKGRLNGVQFEALFENGLYFELGKNAIDRAEELKALFNRFGYRFYLNSPTNQQFIILDKERMRSLSERVRFGFWEWLDSERAVVRFATSFATTEEEIEKLGLILAECADADI